jgi:hypothetical protein
MSNNFISLQEAKSLTARYRTNKDSMVTNDYKNSLPFSEKFDADAVRDLLNQDGCVSFRVYFGLKENNELCSILVGVGADGEDILVPNKEIILDQAERCPPICQKNIL